MVVLISILTGVLMFLLINVIGALYIGDSSNYNENKSIMARMDGLDFSKRKNRRNRSEKKVSLSIFLHRRDGKNKKVISQQFKEALKMINNSLRAGRSIDNAIIKCGDDMAIMYSGKGNCALIESLQKIKFDLEIGVSLEEALYTFEEEWNNEDISDFCDAIIAVRTKGGNMAEIMDNVIKTITDKMEIDMEIERKLYGKKFESGILSFLPIAMFFILSVISRDYMSPLYDTAIGRVLVALSFVLIYLNFKISKKITNIEV